MAVNKTKPELYKTIIYIKIYPKLDGTENNTHMLIYFTTSFFHSAMR